MGGGGFRGEQSNGRGWSISDWEQLPSNRHPSFRMEEKCWSLPYFYIYNNDDDDDDDDDEDDYDDSPT